MKEAVLVNYHEDEIIVKQGDTEKCLYKVMSGAVALYLNYGEDDEYLVGVQSFPNCFGELTILAGRPNLYTAVALGETVILSVPEDAFDAFIHNDPQNAIIIMKTMARNFSMVNMNMNLLVDELKEISKSGGGDSGLYERLADQYGMINLDSAPAPEAADKASAETCVDPLGLYLPGHKGYSGTIHPEYSSYVYKREYSCPHCGKSFSGKNIFRSRLYPKQHDPWDTRFDLREDFNDFDPIWYEIVTCPHCAFSAFTNFFIEPQILLVTRFEDRLKAAAEVMKPLLKAEPDLEHIFTQHYLALICAQGYSTRRQITAKLWTSICWLDEDAGDKKMELLAADRAASALMEVDDCCELTPAQEQRTFLMIAAMLWKQNKGVQAREWAVKARSNRSGRLYSDIAGQLIDEIREHNG